jgi:hypothetical protein
MSSHDNRKDANEQSWKLAKEYSKRIGFVSSVLSANIRLLCWNDRPGMEAVLPVTKYHIGRMVRGPNFKSMLYYFTELVAGREISGRSRLTVGEMLDLLRATDISAFLLTCALTRIVRAVAPTILLQEIRPHLAREAHVGALVGVAVPHLGLAPGMLWGVMPHVAHILMSMNDPALYLSWRRSLVVGSAAEKSSRELEVWRCTSAQVCALLMANLGFSRETACAFELAARYNGPIGYLKEGELQKFRAALLWLETFLNNQSEPNDSLPAHLYPFLETKTLVQAQLSAFSLCEPAWIERSGRDISPEKTPSLFHDALPLEGPRSINPLQEIFTVDALTQMDEWEFDTLLAEIDAEIGQGGNPFVDSSEEEAFDVVGDGAEGIEG